MSIARASAPPSASRWSWALMPFAEIDTVTNPWLARWRCR
jgi:hypothetical protein